VALSDLAFILPVRPTVMKASRVTRRVCIHVRERGSPPPQHGGRMSVTTAHVPVRVVVLHCLTLESKSAVLLDRTKMTPVLPVKLVATKLACGFSPCSQRPYRQNLRKKLTNPVTGRGGL
jgi:hypothetical protein